MGKVARYVYLCLVLWLLWVAGAWGATSWNEDPLLATVFARGNVHGTFVLYDADAGTFVGHDRLRATARFFPASTFKIPNTLIGLAVGAVKSVDEVLPYGGQPQPVAEWERDMSLREAIRISNIPIYQELARRVGIDMMRTQVEKLAYGNRQIGDVVDVFWLKGPLKISAIEQTRFLARLARGELPFPSTTQAATREIVKQETGDGWALYAKTGTAASESPPVGWWVGWVEKAGKIYSFALNIDLLSPDDAAKRASVGRECLKTLGLL